MIKKITYTALGVMAMSFFLVLSVFAGTWQKDGNGWWYQRDDGSYPAQQWEWIDGNKDGIAECYYFYRNGYMAYNNSIDGYTVNNNGQWVLRGEVQKKYVSRNTTNYFNSSIPAKAEPKPGAKEIIVGDVHLYSFRDFEMENQGYYDNDSNYPIIQLRDLKDPEVWMNVNIVPLRLADNGDAGDDLFFVLGTNEKAFYIVLYGNPIYSPTSEGIANFANNEIPDIAASAWVE